MKMVVRYIPKVATCLVLTLLVFSFGSPVYAQDGVNPFLRSCSDYKSGSDFVRQAGYYCLKNGKKSACNRKTAAYFDACGFEGSFKRISSKVHTDLLVMFLVGKAPNVVKVRQKRRQPKRSGTLIH